MRKILISILLATAVTGTAALADPDHDNGRWHHDQQQQQQQPQQRGDRGQGHQQPQRFNGGNFARPQQVQQGEARGFDRSRFVNQQPQQAPPQEMDAARQRWSGERGNWNRGLTGQQSPQVQQQYQQHWNGNRSNWTGQSGDYRQREVVQQQVQNRTRWANGGTWNRDWRNDRRYDWRRYRDSHRSIFHIGVYFDPFGYGYRPFDVGYQLGPAYFGQQYWIDPAMYVLPYPPPGTQWVRYWNDAVLVDMYSGQVVDVIHDFFW